MALTLTLNSLSVTTGKQVTITGFTFTAGNANDFSVDLRNAMLDGIETYAGTSPVLKIRTGSAPATPATADSGTVLSTITLPSDWAAAAASGSKAKSGTWNDANGDADGTAGHWRLYKSDETTVVAQGVCSV